MEKRKLYYSVDPQLENIDGCYETNGNQDITVYSISRSGFEYVPKKQFSFVCSIEGNDEEKIREYLIDNPVNCNDGFGTTSECKLIIL